ncbi:hypothetical protein GZH47_31495 (plasmid) [Paenibacillus rhizovicinus]|uniref:PKD domain-containing protein n=1 Tax=Paenibacillus rhizovicinus TaxID=2704463 RepID=A0A6C0PAL9_9BACL|nr:hypothetical protein [Paenibacillus rhizovicinus]QHW35425.1 hypothetical protein GZH47_31495 [Paenibacillus rhizovicinus]
MEEGKRQRSLQSLTYSYYNAWSEFLEKTITIGTLPQPDEPPHAGFTNPTTVYRGNAVTINSTAWDKEDGARENLPHEYYLQNMDGGTESLASTSRTSWTKTFSTMGTFQFRQTVEDHLGQVDTISHTINVVNRNPVANIYIPNSTDQNNPDNFDTLTPIFKWNYGDPDNDAETKYQVKVYRYGGVLEQDSGIKTGNALNWTPSAALPEHVNMYVVVRVFDGYDWSENSGPHYFYIETNRPPTADFDWSPKPVYEGDTVKITQTIDDPDKDPLTVSYAVKGPDGAQTTYPYTLATPYSTVGPMFKTPLVGTYTVQLTVSDGKAQPVVVTKTIQVLPLTVTGQVKHTDQWNEYRKEYNLKYSGSENSPRAYSVFWAGEKFILAAQTTGTGTTTIANQVKVTMKGTNVNLSAVNSDQTSWSGAMWQSNLDDLPDGTYTFTFTAVYSNGVTKSTDVLINIKDNIWDETATHRIH